MSCHCQLNVSTQVPLFHVASASTCTYFCRKADLLLRQPVADCPQASPRPISTLTMPLLSDASHMTTTETSWSNGSSSAIIEQSWGTAGKSRPTKGFTKTLDPQHVNCHSLHTYSALSQWPEMKTERLASLVLSCLLHFLQMYTGGVFPFRVFVTLFRSIIRTNSETALLTEMASLSAFNRVTSANKNNDLHFRNVKYCKIRAFMAVTFIFWKVSIVKNQFAN